MYDIENYYQAESVKDAVRLLNEHPDARIISGGSDVLIKIREGKFAGTSLVSIHGIKEIQGVKMADNHRYEILVLSVETSATEQSVRTVHRPCFP